MSVRPARPARRRTPRRVFLTAVEAAAALAAADLAQLSVAEQVALVQRVELKGNHGRCADLMRQLVWRETDDLVKQAPLTGRRSERHQISYLLLLSEYAWVGKPETAWLSNALLALLPRLSARQWGSLDWHELAIANRALTIVEAEMPAATCLGIIEKLHQAGVARRHRRCSYGEWGFRWTHLSLDRFVKRCDMPVPATLVMAMLAAPDPETRTFAFEALLPRIAAPIANP